MEKVLELKFLTEGGKTMNLSIQEPKDDVTPQEIATAMQTIIDQNVFLYNGLPLVGIHQARIVERNVTDIELI